MEKPLPISLKLTVMLGVMCEHTISFMMPTVLLFYLEHLSPTLSISEISYQVGLLEFAFGLCALFGGMIWGWVSDRIGRKKTLTLILSGVSISSIGFGLSTSFKVALTWRIFAGMCSGVIPLTKALMMDMSNDSNIGTLYCYFGAGYGAGSIIGPLFGGFLSRPNDFLHLSLKTQFFESFPYFVPFLCQY